jgi:hypothetical protein
LSDIPFRAAAACVPCLAGQEFGASAVHINDGLCLTTRENQDAIVFRDKTHHMDQLKSFSP